ncbi:N-acetylmuramoyl-L-alanine amidase [Vallitalea guaymasensis]|uniref:N-acetylmuramoyl-L-alanine amidase n=1 Tax=Vallitalea guaymasensis TaxID=1185412 RepID=UPI00272B1BF3|nr:N-acetylmuramoyl-L-alanine amidase [Vallitalea guaymasensis]
MIRKIITTVLTITIMLNLFSVNASAETTNNGKFFIKYDGQIYKYKNRFVKLVVDGKVIETGEMPAIVITEDVNGEKVGRTLVPVREVCESEQIGAKVDWNGPKQEAYISYEDKFIVLKINEKKAIVNNKEVMLDVPAKLIQNVNTKKWKTMVPIRFIVETFGYEVNWNGKEYSAEMTKKSNQQGQDNTDEQSGEDDQSENDQTDVEDNKDNETGEDSESSEDQNSNNDNDNEDELLDSLESGGAKNELPTALKNNPVVWMVDDDVLSKINDRYTETTIARKLCPTTKVKSIEYEGDKVNKKFVIEASSPITDVKKSYWKNRLIIDVDNSKWDMDKYEKTFDDNPIITGVRSSQFADTITRIVFDLKGEGYKFNVYLSEDRKKINIEVQDNSVYGIHLGQNDKGDYIKILGVKAPDVKPFRLSNPDRIVFDLPNTESLLSTRSSTAEGQYVKEIRTAQFDETTTRIVIETDGQADYTISEESGSATIIQLIEPSYDNIKYINYDNPTIVLQKDGKEINLSNIKCTDDYTNRKYIIQLPGDYRDLFGNGTIRINDGIINSVDITNDKGNTVLTIDENSVYDYRITEDKDNIYIKAFKPKELYSKVIVIDPGHGGKDPGASDNGLVEKELNFDIVLYLKEYLDKEKDIKVYYTRLDDSYPTLGDRTDLANDVDADFFISVHNNWYTSSAHGTEVYYLAPSSKPGMTSIKLAEIFQKAIVSAVGTKDRGIKSGNLFVLRNTDMPAVLIEVAFLSNPTDVAKLKSETFKKNTANAIYKAILEAFKKYPTGR